MSSAGSGKHGTCRSPGEIFNQGLKHKQRREWGDALGCFKRYAKARPHDQAGWWNLGTAATALGEWGTARRAWREFGLHVPDGDDPWGPGLGIAFVRLCPAENAEVVSVLRIDPVRARICNVPLLASGYRYGDVVLHDGEPKGWRETNGRRVPVLDVLERLDPSNLVTLVVEVDTPMHTDATDLSRVFAAQSCGADDWTDGLRSLCPACSGGTVPDFEPPTVWRLTRKFGIAAPSRDDAELLLNQWASGGPGRSWRWTADGDAQPGSTVTG